MRLFRRSEPADVIDWYTALSEVSAECFAEWDRAMQEVRPLYVRAVGAKQTGNERAEADDAEVSTTESALKQFIDVIRRAEVRYRDLTPPPAASARSRAKYAEQLEWFEFLGRNVDLPMSGLQGPYRLVDREGDFKLNSFVSGINLVGIAMAARWSFP